jgi:tRNA threonylcarbamoyl adenosine modification protein (Sua5/YciO/YrdC/YwlC family)
MGELPTMGHFFEIHPTHPQGRLIARAVEIIRNGGVIAYPTDSVYALGCLIGNKQGLDRIRSIRKLDKTHNFTLVCRDLSDVGTYARLDNSQYRQLKAMTPGPYTFILRASAEVPRRLMHEKRKTIGLRVPENVIAQQLLGSLGEPMMSSTLVMPGEDLPLSDPEIIRHRLENVLDLVIDGGFCGNEPTTVIDLQSDAPELLRQGAGEFPLR